MGFHCEFFFVVASNLEREKVRTRQSVVSLESSSPHLNVFLTLRQECSNGSLSHICTLALDSQNYRFAEKQKSG